MTLIEFTIISLKPSTSRIRLKSSEDAGAPPVIPA